MIKKLLLSALLLPGIVFAQAQQGSDLWDRAAYGSVPGISYVELQGINGAITTTFEPVWGESAAYTLLTAALSSPYCASTSASDDSGSTGAETMVVTGVDTSYNAWTQTLTMDGQTSVNLTTSNIYFINSMRVTGAGSGFTNAGVIACGTGANTSGDPAVIHSYMGTGYGIAQTAMYVVPANHSLICRNWSLTSYGVTAAQTVEFVVDSYYDPIADKVLNRRTLGHLNQAGASSYLNPEIIKFSEKTAVILQALSAASTGPVAVRAECLLIESASENTNQTQF